MDQSLLAAGRAEEDVTPAWSVLDGLKEVLQPLASLRLTVALLAMSIVLVFVGTLAQTEMGIWALVNGHFRAWIAWVDPQVFSQHLFLTENIRFLPQGSSFRIPLPGGKLIGLMMAINLLAAHGVRFKVKATGVRLATGIATIAVGCGLTALIIIAGSRDMGPDDAPLVPWSIISIGIKTCLGAAWFGSLFALFSLDRRRIIERCALLIVLLALTGVLGWITYRNETLVLSPASLRILWQLAQGGLAGAVLLAGCYLVFYRRAGIVLLHAGIGLLMFNELLVYAAHDESQMRIQEGQTVSFVEDIRADELAVVDRSFTDTTDQVTAVPGNMLRRSAAKNAEPIVADHLPFDIRVRQYLPNANLRQVKSGKTNLATAGSGAAGWVAEEIPQGVGTDKDVTADYPAAYVEFIDRSTGKSLGTYMLSTLLAFNNHAERIQLGNKQYDLYLRFKRNYRPYSIRLLDVRKDDYVGTNTPRNYSSEISLVDPSRNTDRTVRIRMNNPLRYAGETFYQQTYMKDPQTGREASTLQVVRNTGWMIPYVSCMIVGFGMVFQFGSTLLRFLRGREMGAGAAGQQVPAEAQPTARTESGPRRGSAKARTKKRDAGTAGQQSGGYSAASVLPVVLLVLALAWIGYAAWPPGSKPQTFDLEAFGKLPVAYQGRVKPMDTLARNALTLLSERQTFKPNQPEDTSDAAADESAARQVDQHDKDRNRADSSHRTGSQPAIRWLLDVIAGKPASDDYPVFRITNIELLDLLKLTRREGYRYALNEFRDQLDELDHQVDLLRDVDHNKLSAFNKQVLELNKNVHLYFVLQRSHQSPVFAAGSKLALFTALENANRLKQTLEDMMAPLSVPNMPAGSGWETVAEVEARNNVRRAAQEQNIESVPELAATLAPEVLQAFARSRGKPNPEELDPKMLAASQSFLQQMADAALNGQSLRGEENPAALAMVSILAAYQNNDVESFNSQVKSYQSLLNQHGPKDVNTRKLSFETFFNRFNPFTIAMALYLVGFLLAALGWLGWTRPLNRSAFWLLVLALVVHTFALVSRIYISGRPPVTNLYSSAVFIGWGCVVLGLVFELIFSIGVGNQIASIAGFTTLFIAYNLAARGDTFEVLQAVLDTQFWLATHVVCITLGYSTTFLAGLFGIAYVVLGMFSSTLGDDQRKDLSRMIYGTLCFATVFSFIGTVLGGLWADDSWGRFWGWDPKENGALIIVLWNALVLHARWGGLVKQRGVAVLAIAGNIVTAWSWFGVNELGVGLHSYGFTEGTRYYLMGFFASQLALIALGSLPPSLWRSRRQQDRVAFSA